MGRPRVLRPQLRRDSLGGGWADMATTQQNGSRRINLVATVSIAVAAALPAAVLWIVTLPLLSRATSTSLAVASLVAFASALRTVFEDRRLLRDALVSAAVQVLVLWPLFWLMFSYADRHQ